MKLRIKGNSIRLRLGRSEVSDLVTNGAVEESTTFDFSGRQRFEYKLLATSDVSSVSATFVDGCLTVRIPTELAAHWGSTDQIGIEATQAASANSSLRILIEKDLECLDAPPEESQADAFPRSSQGVACS
jgi:hypothetical protein